MNARKVANPQHAAREKPVSLAPLKFGEALAGLLAIPDPDATKPKNRKKRKPE
jgi:hypothetical protein